MKSNNKTSPAQIVMWVVDDDNNDPVVSEPICDCLKAFVASLSPKRAVLTRADDTLFETNTDLALRSALRWKYVISCEAGSIEGLASVDRPIDFVVYGFGKWDPLEKYLDGRIPGPMNAPIWPHLAFTDLYKGIRTAPRGVEDIHNLPGYDFAKKCIDLRIPCITFTSEPRAFDTHSYLFQGRPLYYCPRSGFIGDGYVFQTLREELWPKLSRTVWLPELKLALEGRKNPGGDTFNVSFKVGGKSFCHIPAMGGTLYAYLYIWAYASVLARLKGWDAELERWDKATCGKNACVAVCRPTDATIEPIRCQMRIFEGEVWKNKKSDIFYFVNGDVSDRNADILNANIIHLDTPTIAAALPAVWGFEHAKQNLKRFLIQILPSDGLAWLRSVAPDHPEIKQS